MLRKIGYWIVIAVAALGSAFFLLATYSFGQQQVGAIKTPQVNSDFFVGQTPGFYPTIQSATTKACTTAGARVVIPAGTSPSDSIGSVVGGCTTVSIEDRRQAPAQAYTWSGSAYVAINPTAAPSGPASAVQIANSALNGTDSDPNITINKATHNLAAQSMNAVQAAGVGNNNTTINQTLANATGSVKSITVPANYAGTDAFTQVNTQAAVGSIGVCGGFGCTAGQIQSVSILSKGSYPSQATCQAATALSSAPISGTPATVTPVCVLNGASRWEVSSYNIVNTTGQYTPNNFFTATSPNPPANAPFHMLDQTNGAQAKGPTTYVRDFCHVLPSSVNDTSVDNTDCIIAAFAEATRRANALGLGNTQPRVSFGAGDQYHIGHYTTFIRGGGDNGAAPTGNCNGSPCTALAPISPALIPCAIPYQSNIIVDFNGANINGPWNGSTLDLNDGALFCGPLYNGKMNGPAYITNAAVGFIIPQNFQKGFLDNLLFSNVGAAAIILTQDRSVLSDITVTGLTGVIIGGYYTSRYQTQLASEAGGYCDTCSVRGTWIYNQLGSYDDVNHPITSNRIPLACTNTMPSGPAHVSIQHQWDDWFAHNFSLDNCINPTQATITTAIAGMTFQSFTYGIAGNTGSIAVDATTNSVFPYSSSGTAVTIYAKKADGTNRTLGSLAAEINGADGIQGSGNLGAFRVNVTGDPTATFGANSAVNWAGGAASPRLVDGLKLASVGTAGHALTIYSPYDRPSNGVDLNNFQCEGNTRGCVTIASAVNGLEAVHISTEGSGLCNAGQGVTFGTPECPDPYNFFTVPSGSAIGPINTGALEVLNSSEVTGNVEEADGYPALAHAVAGGVSISLHRYISPSPNTQSAQYVTQACASSATIGCPGEAQYVNYSVLYGNSKPNQIVNQLMVDPATNMDIMVVGEQSGQMIGVPNQGAMGAPGFVNVTSTAPTQYPFTAKPFTGYGLPSDPGNVPKSFFYYNNTLNQYRVNLGDNVTANWASISMSSTMPEVAAGGTYTVTATDNGKRIVFDNGGTLNLGLITGVDGPSQSKFQVSVVNFGANPVSVIQTAGGSGSTGVPSSIPQSGNYTFWTYVFGHVVGQWYSTEFNGTGGSGGTDYWWSQNVGCSVGGTLGDNCAGTVQLPGNMTDANYYLQCTAGGIAGGSYSLTLLTNPASFPTTAGSNINYEVGTVVSPGGSQIIQAMCHAHHP